MNQSSKIDLFCREVETHIAAVQQSLRTLKIEPTSTEQLDRAILSTHSIWGTATLVEIEAAASLANRMKLCLQSIQTQSIPLDSHLNDVLGHASDLLLGMRRAVAGNFQDWLNDRAWDLTITHKSLTITDGLDLAEHSPPIPEHQSSNSKATITQPSSTLVSLETTVENIPTHLLEAPVTSPQTPDPAPQASANQTAVVVLDILESPESLEIPPVLQPESPPVAAPPPFVVGDSSMMELFRLEAETQVTVLNEGLLELENNPQSAPVLETLMRAAHSIKGAARIVMLDPVVNLAHVMEDCFVAAQKKAICLNPDHIDFLLRSVDLLQGISESSDATLPQWLAEHHITFITLQSAITAILNPGANPQPVSLPNTSSTSIKTPTPPHPSQPNPASSESITVTTVNPPEVKPASQPSSPVDSSSTTESVNQDRIVRVSAENLNRIMGLAGESLIEANWLQPHTDSMMSLKWKLFELSRTLEQLQNAVDQGAILREGKTYLESARQEGQKCLEHLSTQIGELEQYAQRTANLSDRLYREVISSNMRPFTDGVQGFPRMIRDLARKLNKQVSLVIVGKSTPVDRDILKKLEAPLTHILRNAVDHGLELPADRIAAGKAEEGTIRLEATHRGGMLAITIADDGKGIDLEQLRQKVVNKNFAPAEMAAQMSDAELLEFLFLPGFSTAKQVTEISGRGVGLDIAKSMAQEVGGTVRAMSQLGKGTSFYFQLPLTLSVVRTLLVEISGRPYAMPLASIEQIVTLDRSLISNVEDGQYFTMNQQNVGLICAHQVLELPEPLASNDPLSVVVVGDRSNCYGLVVDQFLGEQDLVVRPLDPRLGKVPDISATSLLSDGSPILIIDVADIMRSMDRLLNIGKLEKVGDSNSSGLTQTKKILVVEDSITVREMERRLLESYGYEVDTTINGMDGWNALRTNHYDLVISDIDMPRMNGIELVRQIKGHPRLNIVPTIIVSYRDREEDRILGLEAGADYYLTKSSFHNDAFINAVIDLIGE
jgi:two-component system, chemotaxis family, sensor histidine kinase and response regulator WspE